MRTFSPERLFQLRRPDVVPVLGGQHHRIQPHWLSVLVFYCDLGFSVRQQAPLFLLPCAHRQAAG